MIAYLEIVTADLAAVDAVCAAYAAAHGLAFGEPDHSLGDARTAPLGNGGMVGVRVSLGEHDTAIARPYWLVEDLDGAVAAVEQAGAFIALRRMELPGHGACAIYFQGGVQHGLWEREK